MSNPNWLNFPGVANLTQDADGRPQTVDLQPGKNRGTLLNSLFFNPILRKICDLSDTASVAISGVNGAALGRGDFQGYGLYYQGSTGLPVFIYKNGTGDFVYVGLASDSAIRAALNAEAVRAQTVENTLVSGVSGSSPGNGDRQISGLFYQGVTGLPCCFFRDAGGNPIYNVLVTVDRLRQIISAGDYATNAAVNAEANRAQNVENTLVSGTLGAALGGGDFQGLGLFYQGSSNSPCLVYRRNGSDLIYEGLVSVENLFKTLGGYATNAAVNAEAVRAQNVENTLVSGTFGAALGNGDFQCLGLFYQGSSNSPCLVYRRNGSDLIYEGLVSTTALGGILSRYQIAGDYATNAAVNSEAIRAQNVENTLVSGTFGASLENGDFQGLGLFYQGVTGLPCCVYRIGSGDPVYAPLATVTYLVSQLQRYATNDGLNSAVAGRVSKSGDTIAGPLTFNGGNPLVPWAGSPELRWDIGDGFANIWTQADADGVLRLIFGCSTPGQPYRSWVFNSTTGGIATPYGNSIPEVIGFGNSRVVDQAFIVSGVGSGGPLGEVWISFPTPFREGTVPVVTPVINREPGAVSRAVAFGNIGNSNTPNVTNTGFSFQPWYATGGNIGASGQPWTLHVRAVGVV